MDSNQAYEEIAFIKKIIEDSRKSIIYSGRDFIFWGILAALGMIATPILGRLHFGFYIFWFWVILIFIGWIYGFYNYYKDSKKRKFMTFGEKIVKQIWIGCGIAMAVCGFIGSYFGAIHYNYINPILAAILGLGHFVTGFIIGYKFLRVTSIFWWIGAIVMFSFAAKYNMYIMAAMMVFLQVMPGIILYHNSKKTKERNQAINGIEQENK